jgi:hypothetical protein
MSTIKPTTCKAAERNCDRPKINPSVRPKAAPRGLEIVRKTLGQHDIATMQTTAIDQVAGIVNLTTVLAHASGEWISSDWPVCPISETGTPHRMGAALTYARRYALFTLVGIAGEDDLDAPDLVAPTPQTVSKPDNTGRSRPQPNAGRLNAASRSVEHRTPIESPKTKFSMQEPGRLTLELSAKLRDEMIAELNDVGTSEEAAGWAKRRYPDKGKKLTSDDAAVIDQCFRLKLLSFATQNGQSIPESELDPSNAQPELSHAKKSPSESIDKGVLSFPEPRRVRDRDHIRYVAQQSCLVCGRKPSDAHHLRFVQTRALGRKVSDEFTVPLCRGHHRELHRHGDEAVRLRSIRRRQPGCYGSRRTR